MSALPPLVEKALVDSGFDLISGEANGWVTARISGAKTDSVMVRATDRGTILAVSAPDVTRRIGLTPSSELPTNMKSSGLATTPHELYRALRLLHTLFSRPVPSLSSEVAARLASIPVTERTREVRERIGQEVFREALMEFWDRRCGLSGIALPSALLRASHAKPWKLASNTERLDPFNGLLLAVRYDALFDKGLIAFDESGQILISPSLTNEVRRFVGLSSTMRLQFVLPGHLPYLRFHREQIAGL